MKRDNNIDENRNDISETMTLRFSDMSILTFSMIIPAIIIAFFIGYAFLQNKKKKTRGDFINDK